MKTLWVLENIKGKKSFYDKFDFLMMFASVVQWKKHHPDFHCVLYADKMTLEVITNLGARNLWDETQVLKTNKSINKRVFWAASKLQALRFLEEPTIMMDNDFVVYTSFKKFLHQKVVVSHIEDGLNYYITPTDHFVKQVKHLINRYKQEAVNCSFVYFPDHKFMQHYAKTSLELMQELSRLKAPNSKYLILAEQLLLKHLMDLNEIKYIPLLDKVYNCLKNVYTNHTKGLIKTNDQNLFFRHYWMDKPRIKQNKKGFSLEEESNNLMNVIKNAVKIDWKVVG